MAKTKKLLQNKLDLIPLYYQLGKAEDDPLKLVILANTFLELLINILVEEKIKNKSKVIDNNEYTYAVKLLVLNEKNIINDRLYKSIEKLRKIRNRAAHEPNFNLGVDDYKELPVRKNMYNICLTVIGTLWNSYKDLFAKYFNI